MKRKSILLAVCMLLMSVSLAYALPEYTVNTTTGRIGEGGPFQINGVTDPSVNFQSFCLETKEYLSLPGQYYGSIDSRVYYSSGGYTASTPINVNTAKLYNYFLDNSGLTAQEKRNIQLAIWMYQDQPGIVDDPTNFFFANASTLVASNRTIMALNLWDANVVFPYDNECDYSHKVQSVLIATPEPGILLLLGIGLVGLAGLRRKE